MNPKNWSAKAQAIACLLVPILVYVLNKQFALELDANVLLGLFGLGAVAGGSVAIIDHGEPAEVIPPPSPLTDAEKATAKSLLPPATASKLGLTLLVSALLLTGCSSGIGRATSLAVSGVPASVPTALDSIEAEYDLRAGYQMSDILASEPTTDAGIVLQEEFKNKLQARIDATHQLLDDLRTWIGVTKGASPTATQDSAEKTRAAAVTAIIERINQARLKKAAEANKPVEPKKED